jgi:hypothetical protein
MAIDNNLRVDELNFQGIKDNFKRYLQAQDQFRDYNFDGSGMSVLLDMLAYNTYYNSFYLNMVASEAFLATAQKRNSVVNLANSLNYLPRSTSSASITGTITLTVANAPSIVTIPEYTEFNGTIDGVSYKFLNVNSKTISSNAGVFSDTITLKEGTLITTRYTVVSSDADQRFLIPNSRVDTTTLNVTVLNSAVDSTTRTFTPSENLVELDSSSLVYFLQESEDGLYELKFGDGTFGTALSNGNILVIRYLVSNGALANDINALTYSDTITNVTAATFTATSPATGGSARETVAQIKFNAPKSYEAQNRAVTAEDYRALLLAQPTVDSVVVWGGEDNDPPTYGKVFVAIKPTTGSVLTATEKQNLISSVINPKKILTVQTEIVDPEFLYVTISSVVNYDAKKTSLSEDTISNLVLDVIKNYNDAEINTFGTYFRYSKLSRLIDVAERSILSNVLTAQMRKEVAVQLGVSTRYEINFSNAIDNATNNRPSTHPYGVGNKITSNSFTIGGFSDCFLEDNNGIIRIYRTLGVENIAVSINAGTINYTTGKVILTNFAPTAFNDGGTTLKLTAFPQNKDILPLRGQIISIRDEDISVSVIDDNSISLVYR